jgi:malonate transporter and related proteins
VAAIATLGGRLPAELSPRKGTGVKTIVLDCLAPVFFGMALGYLAGWTRDVDNKHVGELNALVMDFAVPAAIFAAVVQQSRSALLDQLPLAAIVTVSMLIIYFLTYVLAIKAFGASPADAAVQALTTSLPNYAGAGLPLIAALLGSRYVFAVGTSLGCGGSVLSPLALVVLERSGQTKHKGGIGNALLGAFKKPIVLAPLLAVLFVLTNIGLPDPLIRSLSLMGEVSGGAALFLTGLILSAQRLRVGANVVIHTFLSDALRPLIAAALVWFFAVSGPTARESIILSALPAGFFGVLFGLRFGISSDVVGTTLSASTVLSAATLPAAIYFTAGLGQQ